MLSVLVRAVFGTKHERDAKRMRPTVEAINALGADLERVPDAALRASTDEFRKRLADGAEVDDLLVEAFAVCREAARRTVRMRHFDVQLMGGMVLHQGKIAEMATGEGKTLVATLPVYLNALPGLGTHIVTVNDYLARRDAQWMGPIYHALGLSLGVIQHEVSYLFDPAHVSPDIRLAGLRPCSRREAYHADVTYGTNNEYGFDYLRDNIEFDVENLRQRKHTYAIIDEVDSILIDEARTPLIISAPAADSENLYDVFSKIARQLHEGEHYELDEKHKSATLTDAGIESAERMLGIENIYTDRGIKYVHHLETAVRAQALYLRDRDYVVKDNEVIIVDEFTGRLQIGRRWSDGLHQAVESKEGVTIQKESRTYASITFQNYFRMYGKLAGMTGTALTSQEEFYSVYKLDVIPVPTNKPIDRKDHNDLIFQTEAGKYKAIIRKIKELNERGQPILIGTVSIEKNEEFALELTKAGVPYEMLNAKNHEREGEIIASAGEKGKVTLATNMAGRGVDIKLGGIHATKEEAEAIKALGGLFVLGTERHEARRIDDQLRGRSGRQGDPGETQFFVSMEDSLMRVFASDAVKNMMGRFGIPEDQPIENKMITRSLESAQKKIEGFHFDSRKHVLAYDDVLSQQRQVIYKKRNVLLRGTDNDIEELLAEVVAMESSVQDAIVKKEEELGKEVWLSLARRLMLQVYDILWVEHLEVMQYTRTSVGLRAYGQQDPLIEYRKEGKRLFAEMQEAAQHRLIELIPMVRTEAVEKEEEALRKEKAAAQRAGGALDANGANTPSRPIRAEPKIGRNDMVTITNGTETKELKFKKAEPLIANGWQLVE